MMADTLVAHSSLLWKPSLFKQTFNNYLSNNYLYLRPFLRLRLFIRTDMTGN